MNMRTILIAVSVLANVGLAVLWWRGRPADAVAPARTAVVDAPKSTRPIGIPLSAEAWKAVTSPDDSAYVANLRAQGFPPEVIRALVYARVWDSFLDRRRAVRQKERPYWKGPSWSMNDTELRAAQRQLYQDVNEKVKELMGPDGDLTSPRMRAEQKNQYGSVAPEKVDQLKALEKDYAELKAQVNTAAKGVVLREDREKLAYLEQQRRTDLAKLLTPEELSEYDLRASPSAQGVRFRLAIFDPTEDEYRKLASMQLAFDSKYGMMNLTVAEQQARNDAEAQLNEQIKATLGDDRYAEYQIATDGSYRSVDRITQALKLPAETTREVIKLQQAYKKQVTDIRNDPSLSAEARNSQLANLANEASNKLVIHLGAEGLDAYQKSSGQWLARLKAPAKK